MLKNESVRTIKPTDGMWFGSPDERCIASAKYRARNVPNDLQEKLDRVESDLAKEQEKQQPDMERISRLMGIIANINQTIKMKQR